MKRNVIYSSLAVFLIALLVFSVYKNGIQITHAQTIDDISGNAVSLDFQHPQSPITIIVSISGGCADCNITLNQLITVANTFPNKVTIIGVDVNPSEKGDQLRSYLSSHDLLKEVHYISFNPNIIAKYNIFTIGQVVILNNKGQVKFTDSGVQHSASSYIDQVKTLL